MVQHERVPEHRFVAPQADLRGQLHGTALFARASYSEPGREIGHSRARQDGVCPECVDAFGEVSRRERRRTLPGVRRRVPVHHVLRGTSRVDRGIRLGPKRGDARVAEALQVLGLVGRLQDPMADPLVVVVAPGGGAGLDPEVVVLAVAVDRQVPGEQSAGVRAHRHLADREHAVGRNPHVVRPRSQIIDDALHGDDRAPARAERTPHTFEQWWRHRHVAGTVGDGCMQDGDVGLQRREETDGAEGRRDLGEGVVLGHGRSGDRTGGDRRQSAGARLEPLREREERPVLHRDRARGVAPLEPRVRGEVRERVAGVAGDDLLDETTPEEQCPEAGQAQHHEGEPRIPVPPLPDHLTDRGAPACVSDHDVQRVTGAHVLAHRVGDTRHPVRSGHRQPASSTRSATRRRCQDRPPPSASFCLARW